MFNVQPTSTAIHRRQKQRAQADQVNADSDHFMRAVPCLLCIFPFYVDIAFQPTSSSSLPVRSMAVLVAPVGIVCWLLACLTSQQNASVSQGRICTDNFACCHTEIEVADQTPEKKNLSQA